jgi:hypothetical protein
MYKRDRRAGHVPGANVPNCSADPDADDDAHIAPNWHLSSSRSGQLGGALSIAKNLQIDGVEDQGVDRPLRDKALSSCEPHGHATSMQARSGAGTRFRVGVVSAYSSDASHIWCWRC